MRYVIHHFRICLTGVGELRPWLGPALRGMTARPFKDRVCRFPPLERDSRWVHCHGCPHMASCPYGQTFEPDPPPERNVFRGREDAARPVVLAPYFPVPARATPGLEVPLRILGVGTEAVRHLPALAENLALAGKSRGLGEEGVKFELRTGRSEEAELCAADLPASPDVVRGTLPRVGIGLTSPLFLEEAVEERKKKRPIEVPSFADLFRAALRSVGELFRLYGEPLEADFRALRQAAEAVPMLEHCYEPFEQEKWSSRGRQRFLLHGVIGGGVYGNVPLSLLPWLLWGGRMHVGGHRIAGAGGWRLVLE